MTLKIFSRYGLTFTLDQMHRASVDNNIQCILPALDGLLPAEQGSGILDLIFVMGCWHSYAKLRLHTEDTLTSFEQITVHLGVLLRQFATECRSIKTVELPRERQARMRNSAKKGKPTGGAKLKEFSLSTFKLHALGHYPRTIRERGTTDNYSTQWVWVVWWTPSV